MLIETSTTGAHSCCSSEIKKEIKTLAGQGCMPQSSESDDLGRVSNVIPISNFVSTQGSDQPATQEDVKPSSKKSHGAFEFKFLVTDDCANEIRRWASLNLGPDQYYDPEIGDGYRVNSLYLDTPYFDHFHRMAGHRKRKFRLRRYGKEPLIYFEQKQKRQGFVRKKRVAVPETEFVSRLQSDADQNWEGHWFRKRIDENLLRPVCQITYQRFARVTQSDEGPRRLTIDCNIIAAATDDWQVPRGDLEGVQLLEGQQILELKFRGAMPAMFRQLIDSFSLYLTSFSKYRTGVEECIALDSISCRIDRESDCA